MILDAKYKRWLGMDQGSYHKTQTVELEVVEDFPSIASFPFGFELFCLLSAQNAFGEIWQDIVHSRFVYKLLYSVKL